MTYIWIAVSTYISPTPTSDHPVIGICVISAGDLRIVAAMLCGGSRESGGAGGQGSGASGGPEAGCSQAAGANSGSTVQHVLLVRWLEAPDETCKFTTAEECRGSLQAEPDAWWELPVGVLDLRHLQVRLVAYDLNEV